MSSSEAADYRSLGEVLRDTREQKTWTLDFVAEKTRISMRMLKALEVDDLETLSGIVYARGFVRTLAGLYDLDVEFLYAKLDALAKEIGSSRPPASPIELASDNEPKPEVVAKETPEPARKPVWQVETTRVRRVETRPSFSVSPRVVLIGAAALLGAVLILGWAGGWFTREVRTPSVPTASEGADSTGIGEAEFPPAGFLPESGIESAFNEVELSEEEFPLEVLALRAKAERVPGGDVGESVPVESSPATEASTAAPARSEGAVRGLPSVVRPGEGGVRRVLFRVRATADVWFEVAVDGKPPVRRDLRAGEEFELTGSDHFVVRVSDSRSIRVDVGGTRRMPPRTLTRDDEWFVPAAIQEPR